MTPVTIDSGAQSSYYSSGTVGWSARSSFAYYSVIAQPTGSGDVYAGYQTTAYKQAQSVVPSSTVDITRVKFQIGQFGSPTDNMYVEIQSDSGSDKPSNTVLGTSATVSGTLATANDAWISFDFSTAVTLTGSTQYWLVFCRSGATDAAKAYSVRYNSTSQISSAGQSSMNTSNVWSARATADLVFQMQQAAPVALYHVSQDTGGSPKLHMWRSTDNGATWTEQDSGNAPSVNNGAYPFDAALANGGSRIVTASMTSANIVEARAFDMATNVWLGKIGVDAQTQSYYEQPMRITAELGTGDYGPLDIITASSGDLSDLRLTRRASSSWSSSTFLAITSAGRSLISDVVIDSTGYGNQYRFYYDDQTQKFRVNSQSGGSASTAVDVDATAATSDSKYAGATYEVYTISGVEYVIAAYIDSDDTIHERIATLGTASASMSLASASTVSSATTSAGRSLSTCRFDGKNYIFAAVSGTGIDYYESSTAGTWTGPTSLVSGLTNCTLSQALSIPGVGVAVFYTDNGDDKVELFTGAAADVNATGTTADAVTATANAGSLAISANVTGTTTAATATANAGSISIPANVSGTTATVTSAANAGSLTYGANLTGTTAAATVNANAGSLSYAASPAGTTATATSSANAGTLTKAPNVPGTTATATATAKVATPTIKKTGTKAAATASGKVAVENISITGTTNTVTATASAGSASGGSGATVNGTTVTATVAANAGQPSYAATVNGTTATAIANANAGSVTYGSNVTGQTSAVIANSNAGSISSGGTITGHTASATTAANAGSVPQSIIGTTANVTASAAGGYVTVPASVSGSTASAGVGTFVSTITIARAGDTSVAIGLAQPGDIVEVISADTAAVVVIANDGTVQIVRVPPADETFAAPNQFGTASASDTNGTFIAPTQVGSLTGD